MPHRLCTTGGLASLPAHVLGLYHAISACIELLHHRHLAAVQGLPKSQQKPSASDLIGPSLDQGCHLCVGVMSETVSLLSNFATPSQVFSYPANSHALQADPSANASDVSGLLLGGTLVPDQLRQGIVVILTEDGSLGETTITSSGGGQSPVSILLDVQ